MSIFLAKNFDVLGWPSARIGGYLAARWRRHICFRLMLHANRQEFRASSSFAIFANVMHTDHKWIHQHKRHQTVSYHDVVKAGERVRCLNDVPLESDGSLLRNSTVRLLLCPGSKLVIVARFTTKAFRHSTVFRRRRQITATLPRLVMQMSSACPHFRPSMQNAVRFSVW